MVIAPTCPNVSLNPEAKFGYIEGSSICIMSFNRWQKLMAKITLNTVVSADDGVATPGGASGWSIFSFLIGPRHDTTATEDTRSTSGDFVKAILEKDARSFTPGPSIFATNPKH